ncbi:Uncharacterised protein [Segatella copri]|nr:Uncharacterised protein [Segatella copri]
MNSIFRFLGEVMTGCLRQAADGIKSPFTNLGTVFQVYARAFGFRRKRDYVGPFRFRLECMHADALFASQFDDGFTFRSVIG